MGCKLLDTCLSGCRTLTLEGVSLRERAGHLQF